MAPPAQTNGSGGASGSQRKVGDAKEGCPLRTASILVQVLRADTHEPIGAATVDVKGPTPGTGQTTAATGTTRFAPVDPGDYTTEATLAGPDRELFEPADKVEGSVEAGSELVQLIEFFPLGALKVKVYYLDQYDAMPRREPVGGAHVKVTGGSNPGQKLTAEGTGLADFGRVRAARYKIVTWLTGENAKLYKNPWDRSASVPPGETVEVPIPLDGRPSDLDLDFSSEADDDLDLDFETEADDLDLEFTTEVEPQADSAGTPEPAS